MGQDNGLSMNYEEMEAQLGNLETEATEFEGIVTRMQSTIAALCDNWTSTSTETFREDYTKLVKNFNETIEIVRSLISENNTYIQNMRNADSAYSNPKVM